MCIIFERSNNTKRKSQKEREKAESQKERGGGGERFSYFLLLVTFAINWFNQATITDDRGSLVRRVPFSIGSRYVFVCVAYRPKGAPEVRLLFRRHGVCQKRE